MDDNGIIDGNKVYTINAFCRELGFKRNSSKYQELMRAGLKPILGKYIRGRDFIQLLGQLRDGETTGKKPQNQSDRTAARLPLVRLDQRQVVASENDEGF